MTIKQLWICALTLAPAMSFAVEVDTIALKGGYSYANSDTSNENGGVNGVNDIGDNGTVVGATVVFNTSLSDYFKPYIDIAGHWQDDRRFIIPGAGLRHDILLDDSRFEPFYAFGLGYNYAKWNDSPADNLDVSNNSGESFVFTAQTGFDYYISDNLALDLTLRLDSYHIDSTLVQNNRVTTIDDKASFSLMTGLVYRFGASSTTSHNTEADDDNDGVSNHFDRCPDTLKNVPVNEAGCPQYRFDFSLNFDFAEFDIDHIVNHPSFDTIAFLKKNPHYRVKIVGYTDSVGGEQFNQALAEKRAQEAMRYLTANGIEASRVDILGRGEHEPRVKNDSDLHRSQNRRIDIEFYRHEASL
jgi:outer membrane protein OmpA-like peptidoglycan-associated protein